MTTFAMVDIHREFPLPADPSVDYKNVILRAEVTRSVNAVGNWEIIMRNIGGEYNTTFDVHNYFQLDINNVGDTLIKGRLDGPAVELIGRDLESIWDEYVVLRGVDNAQDMLFHNDFAHEYPDKLQNIDYILNHTINVHLAGITNIGYTPIVGTPTVGAFEFREGGSFLSQVQELHRRANYLFYVEDDLTPPPPLLGGVYKLRCGLPDSLTIVLPTTYSCMAGFGGNNILGAVEYWTRDGDKHYNYVRLYGKAPMFDGYTEYNAVDWDVPVVLGGSTVDVLDDVATTMVGEYSIVACSNAATTSCIGMRLDAPVYNYLSWDMRNGEIGIWARYDNNAGVPGTDPPGVGGADTTEYVWCALTDAVGNQAYYYGASTLLYRDKWGYCTFPLGDNSYSWIPGIVDAWSLVVGGSIDWQHIVSMEFVLGLVGNAVAPLPASPSHFYIDGIGLPFPTVSIAETDVAVQNRYRRRPYIDNWFHLRTQNALDASAIQVLLQSGTTLVDRIRFMTSGSIDLRYAGQSFLVNIPPLGINNTKFYATSLHHVIEPHADVSKGYGFDWVVEVDAVPTGGISYDHARLGTGEIYSPNQKIAKTSTGVR